MEYLTVLAPRSLYETVLGGYMASGPGSQLSTVFCLLLWQTAIGETPQKTLVVGSNIALVAWLRCVELSQGEFGSGPARCGLDAILKVKYERRAASSTDSTTAPLRPGSLCKTAHNSPGQRRREAAEFGGQEPLRCSGGKPEEAAMARCGNRPQREHRKGRRGQGAFLVFLFTRHGQSGQGADRLIHHNFCHWIFTLKMRHGCCLHGGWPLRCFSWHIHAKQKVSLCWWRWNGVG